jgi:PAS domain S-box-containing protein
MADTHILVVEDDAIVARNIQLELNSMGYAVPAIASTGEEALEKAAQTHPDLVLMDISLGGTMDGVRTAERLREQSEVPVVYLTAYTDEQTLQRAKKTEPYGYLIKPYEEKELHTTVQLALYKYKMDRMLKENQEWLATILRCIGDGVAVTDAGGCIRMLNPVAQRLTGWQQDEALGKDLPEIFCIIDQRTRRPLPNPATKARQCGAAVSVNEHCLLVGRDGRETPIEGNAAPVTDDRGSFAGFVLAFRDVSQRGRRESALNE